MPRITFTEYLKKNLIYKQAYNSIRDLDRKIIIEEIYNVANRAIAETQLWIPVPANRIQIIKASKKNLVRVYLYQKEYDSVIGENIIQRGENANNNPYKFLVKGFLAMFVRAGTCGNIAASASFFMARELGRLCAWRKEKEIWKDVEITMQVTVDRGGNEHNLCKIELPKPEGRIDRKLENFHKLTSWYVDPWIQEHPVSQYFVNPRGSYKMKTGYKRDLDTAVVAGLEETLESKFTLRNCEKLKTLFVDEGEHVYHNRKKDIINLLKRTDSSPEPIIAFSKLSKSGRRAGICARVKGEIEAIPTAGANLIIKLITKINGCNEERTRLFGVERVNGDAIIRSITSNGTIYNFFSGDPGKLEKNLANSLLYEQIHKYYDLTSSAGLDECKRMRDMWKRLRSAPPALPRKRKEIEQLEAIYPIFSGKPRRQYPEISGVDMLKFIKRIIFD